MSKRVSNSNATGVRRLTGEERATSGKLDRLILSSNLRVADAGILLLEPKHAVNLSNQPTGKKTPGRTKANPTPISVAAEESIAPPAQEVSQSFGINDLTAKITALETAIAKTADQWEPDGVSGDAYAGTSLKTMAWQESVELDAKGTPVTGQGARRRADQHGQPQDDTPLPDEDAVRDLVAAIVQSELQGDLGERITRNVRTLVQREINLALAARKSE